MQLDEFSNAISMKKVLDIFRCVFDEDMLFVSKEEAVEHMGYFKICYKYLPLEYDIRFENERSAFCIDIIDDEGAKNSLFRISEFDNRTTPENVLFAVKELKRVLKKNDFCFYLTRNEKIYRKMNQEYKRIKDLTELLRR